MRTFKYLSLILTVCLLVGWVSMAQAMNKAELIEAMASESGLSKADSKRALDGFVNATTGALKKGDRISLVGFGALGLKQAIDGPEGKSSLAEVDFVPGSAFAASAVAQNNDFRMTVTGIGDFGDLDSDGDGLGDVDESDELVVLGNGEGTIESKDILVVVPGRNDRAPARGKGKGQQAFSAEVEAVLVDRDGGLLLLVDAWQGPVAGLILRGIEKTDIRRGMVISKPGTTERSDADNPLYEDDGGWHDSPLYETTTGTGGGHIWSDQMLLGQIAKQTRLDEAAVIGAYNALLDIIIDEVNGGGRVDMAGFGQFAEERRLSVAVIDVCKSDPYRCNGSGYVDEDLLDEMRASDYVEWEMSVAATGLDDAELSRLLDDLIQKARQHVRSGRNPQTGKEIKIAAKNKVRFKAGAELSKAVN